MTPDELLNAIASESDRLVSIANSSLDSTVAHAGDWPVRELLEHVGAVYSMVIANVGGGGDAVPPGDEAAAPEGDAALIAWFRQRRQTLLDELTSAGVDAPAWTFAGERTAGWWRRRMASETAVHRWDVDAAVNGVANATAIDGDLAADGIDEYLDVSLRFSSSRPDRLYPSNTLHLHRTDGPGEWMIASTDDNQVLVTHEHGKGDAAVRGPASELLLWVWGRPAGDIEIFGDHSVANAWRELAP